MSRIVDAKQLIEKFPGQTQGYSWKEVADMWEEYSDSMAAGWLIPDQESVNYVFGNYGKGVVEYK